MKQINSRIQLKIDTAALWTSGNPLLLSGEVGFESDTGRFKIGDGTKKWNSLPYKNEENTERIISDYFLDNAIALYSVEDPTLEQLATLTGGELCYIKYASRYGSGMILCQIKYLGGYWDIFLSDVKTNKSIIGKSYEFNLEGTATLGEMIGMMSSSNVTASEVQELIQEYIDDAILGGEW